MNTVGRQLFTRRPFFDASFKHKVLYFWQFTIGMGIALISLTRLKASMGEYYSATKRYSGDFQMPKDLKSLLTPKFVRLIKHKLEKGEMTAEECQMVLKEFMLWEFDRKQAEQSHKTWSVRKLQSQVQAFFDKVMTPTPAEPTISLEELAGTVRARQI
jgi:polyhydroxyalkanoate synthesis regulator phasin